MFDAACGKPPPPEDPDEGAADPPLAAPFVGALGLHAAIAKTETSAKAAIRMDDLLKTGFA
jgi:hypothetical protein